MVDKYIIITYYQIFTYVKNKINALSKLKECIKIKKFLQENVKTN